MQLRLMQGVFSNANDVIFFLIICLHMASIASLFPSSETQGLLAGTMQYLWAKVYFKSWELILTELVPEVVEFCPADWAEKYLSAQSAMRSSRVTLSPSYTKSFFHRST